MCGEPFFGLGSRSKSMGDDEELRCPRLKHSHGAEKGVATGYNGACTEMNPVADPSQLIDDNRDLAWSWQSIHLPHVQKDVEARRAFRILRQSPKMINYLL